MRLGSGVVPKYSDVRRHPSGSGKTERDPNTLMKVHNLTLRSIAVSVSLETGPK